MDDEYTFVIDMYKTKAKAALQFIDNIIVWTILPLLVGLIIGCDKLRCMEITIIFFVVITPFLLIIFSYLKYKEYNYRWKECVVKSLVSNYIKKVGIKPVQFVEVAEYIHNITKFPKDEIIIILHYLYPPQPQQNP